MNHGGSAWIILWIWFTNLANSRSPMMASFIVRIKSARVGSKSLGYPIQPGSDFRGNQIRYYTNKKSWLPLSSPLFSSPPLHFSPLLSFPLLSSPPLFSSPLLPSLLPLPSPPLSSPPLPSPPLLSSPLLSSPRLSSSSPLLSSSVVLVWCSD